MQSAARVTRARAKEAPRGARTAPSSKRGSRTGSSSRGRAAAPSPKPPVRRQGAKSRRGLEARCRSVFTTVVALLVALTSLGLARVAVIARAAEVTISADTLSQRIEEERVKTDQLEIDRSSLTAPSRIEAIAADTMSMGDPASVSYIVMPGGESPEDDYAPDSEQARAEASSTSERLASVMSALLDISAGEAQSLLVGDLALAGSR